MTLLTISLLGPLQITLDGEPITDFATDKARALLAYLIAEADHPHRRDTLAGLLWPDRPQRKARHNLRQTISYLRQAIRDRDDDSDGGAFLLVSRQTVQFNPDCTYWLDVETFAALIEACKGHRHRRLETCLPCVQRLEQMADLYHGDFLAHFSLSDSSLFEEWALLKREWLHREAVEALYHLANYYERRGDYERARHYAWRQVELEPWREEAHRQLMRLLALDGQRSTALAQYETCRRVLAGELGVGPTAETVTLYERIQAGEDFTPSAPLYNLPPAPTPFVGREEELAELAELLANPDCRLVTLLGAGGIGKTRLALQVAADQVGAFAHGVYFVPLASVSSPEFILPTMANVLNLSFDGKQDPEEQLLNYLRQKEMLLVLDNLEHILEGSALLAKVLWHAPGVVLLATSRERVNLREERVYEIEGLTYPKDQAAEEIESYSAVELFAQAARRIQRKFTLVEQVRPSVIRICQMVEGMPLGVELAAAWVPVRSCEEIAGEIERNLDILSTSLRNVPKRHRSLRAAFDHSWNLLSEQEREVFRKLSVFCGGFQAAAAEKVAGAPLPVLSALVDKSLLRRGPSGRYQIHELLRQYAAGKLQESPQERGSVQALHSGHYAAFLQQREDALKGEKQREALEEINTEIDNVRAGWQWAITQIENRQNEALAMAVMRQSLESLYLFYATRDWYQEGEAAFGRVATVLDGPDKLSHIPAREKELLLGELLARQGKCCEFTEHSDKAQQLFERSLAIFDRLGAWRETVLPLYGLGYVAHIKGEYVQAKQYSQRSLATYKEIEDPWGMANVLSNLCLVARRQGAFSEAKQHSQQSLALRRKIGDQRGIASSLSNLGLICCDLGEYAEAKKVLLEALQICRQLDYNIEIAHALTGLCQAAFRLGETDAAKQFGQESLAVFRDIGDRWGMAIAYNNLGHIAMELGDYAEAKHLYQEGIAIYQQTGIKSGLANTLGNLGQVCYKLGEYAEARPYLHEALRIAQEIGAIPIALESLSRLAPLLAQEGETKQSLELLAFTMHQPAILQATKENAEVLFSELAADLPPEDVAAAEARGQTREFDAVVAKVLREGGTD
jgi:predicted ATPase/DNA-binding SARP family transcriptional activator/Tfp pilus assembly protein PilF